MGILPRARVLQPGRQGKDAGLACIGSYGQKRQGSQQIAGMVRGFRHLKRESVYRVAGYKHELPWGCCCDPSIFPLLYRSAVGLKCAKTCLFCFCRDGDVIACSSIILFMSNIVFGGLVFLVC